MEGVPGQDVGILEWPNHSKLAYRGLAEWKPIQPKPCWVSRPGVSGHVTDTSFGRPFGRHTVIGSFGMNAKAMDCPSCITMVIALCHL